jgi:hypothetical protein
MATAAFRKAPVGMNADPHRITGMARPPPGESRINGGAGIGLLG